MRIHNHVEKSGKIVFCMLVDNLTRGLINPGFFINKILSSCFFNALEKQEGISNPFQEIFDWIGLPMKHAFNLKKKK